MGCLHGVVATDPSRHEEGFDPGDEHGDGGPGEDEIEDSKAVATKVELVNAEASKDDGEEHADDFIFAGGLVFCVEPGPLRFRSCRRCRWDRLEHRSYLMNQ